MKKKVLVVIDIQKEYEASKNTGLVNNCIKLINKAKEAGDHIILVSYVNKYWNVKGFTFYNKSILKATEGYKNLLKIEKYQDNGADVIMKGINTRISKNTGIDFTVVGINTGACVLSTVKGLLHYKRSKSINIVSKACNDNHWGKLDKKGIAALFKQNHANSSIISIA